MADWSEEEERARLNQRFKAIKNRAAWAREHGYPGGASFLSQQLGGHRRIGLSHALVLAKAFGVPLPEISPRLAKQPGLETSQAPAAPRAAETEATYVSGGVPGGPTTFELSPRALAIALRLQALSEQQQLRAYNLLTHTLHWLEDEDEARKLAGSSSISRST